MFYIVFPDISLDTLKLFCCMTVVMMGKPGSVRQKEYEERQKELNREEYLKTEGQQ